MASNPSESSPLLSDRPPTTTSPSSDAVRPPRTVTFHPVVNRSTTSNPTLAHGETLRPVSSGTPTYSTQSSQRIPSGPPVLSALNSKLRRRHSQGASYNTVPSVSPTPKIGPQRTSKNTQKLKLLPNPVTGEDEASLDDTIPREVYSQITRIKEPTARRDAARLGKADRDRLPRVTAYCTASSYKLETVMKFFKGRVNTRGSNPKLFEECVYSPYNYDYDPHKPLFNQPPHHDESFDPRVHMAQGERRFSDSEIEVSDRTIQQQDDLISFQDENPNDTTVPEEPSLSSAHVVAGSRSKSFDGTDLDTTIHTPEVFLFDYGTVVIWGMSPEQETRFLREVSKFATSVLSAEDMQIENFNFYYTRDYQARIYNDFISLRDPRSYMTKLAISHALSQSVKTSLFEDLVSETIATTSPLPAQIAQTGSVNLTRRQINMQIGELFILRINIHLQGSVLDSPELMWAEPQLDPIYQAVRSYLEMDQRVSLLTERLEVIGDLLAVLKDQLSHRHGEYLEWIGTC